MTLLKATVPLTWAGTEWLLDNRRVLIHPEERILILSDIHIGYYSSFRDQGSYLPMYDVTLLEEAIETLLEDYNGYHWIIAGDIKHNHAPILSRAEETELVNILEAITEQNTLTLIKGNHDKGLERLLSDLQLSFSLVPSYTFRNITIAHNQELLDQTIDEYTIIGHVHPIISLEHLKGSFVPIFALTKDLLILPAFNYVAGGYNIKKLYYKGEKKKNFTIYALGKQVYRLGELEKLI